MAGAHEKEPFREESFILREITQESREEFRHGNFFFWSWVALDEEEEDRSVVSSYILRRASKLPLFGYTPMTTDNFGLSNPSCVLWGLGLGPVMTE